MKKGDYLLKDNFILLALDPSYTQTGWSVLQVEKIKSNFKDFTVKIIDYGIIPIIDKNNIGKSLLHINDILEQICTKYTIDYACTENCFAGSNRLTIQRLSQVHGVIRMTMAKFNIDIKYYAVMTAKKSVLEKLTLKKENGEKKTGQDLKEEVANKIFEIFKGYKFENITNDVTDAISIGLCFLDHNGEELEKKKKKKKK